MTQQGDAVRCNSKVKQQRATTRCNNKAKLHGKTINNQQQKDNKNKWGLHMFLALFIFVECEDWR